MVKRAQYSTYYLLRWAVLRRHALMDAVAAALDARCLQTSANSGDRAAWRVCNEASDRRCGTKTFFLLSSCPLKTHESLIDGKMDREQNTTSHKPASALRLRCVVAPRCATPFRPPSAASATIASSLRAACPARSRLAWLPCLGLSSFRWRRVPLPSGPSRCENTCKHLCLEANLAWCMDLVS